MAILIANIGTSDLAIKIDDYYFPVGFEWNEPNLDKSGLTDDKYSLIFLTMSDTFMIIGFLTLLWCVRKWVKNF